MSHLTDLAATVETSDDRWALSEHRDRAAAERARDAALTLSRSYARIASRIRIDARHVSR